MRTNSKIGDKPIEQYLKENDGQAKKPCADKAEKQKRSTKKAAKKDVEL